MASLNLKNINKIYPNGVQAVFDFNLDIQDKEFIIFVGPSGCGKSTTLRMIAGLEDITSGELYIDDVLMNNVNPKDRGIAMVFQSYALSPHMTIYNNLAFGLQLRRIPREEIDKRVAEAARILGLEKLLDRYPRQLSGGQNQRVALGRAIVRHAKVFLMDEPLSNLDAKLRVTMRGELTKLHKKLGSTTIYVTHDQIEAMPMASRIVVMRDGRVQQVGTPKEIYEHPANVFVGGFIGTPPMNFIHGTVDATGKFTTMDNQVVTIPAAKLAILKENDYLDKEVILGIRPEEINDDEEALARCADSIIEVSVDVAELLGAETNIYATIGNDSIIASVPARDDLKTGSKVKLAFDMEFCHVFDVETELAVF